MSTPRTTSETKVAFLSVYEPGESGISAFSADLCRSMTSASHIVPVVSEPADRNSLFIDRNSLDSYVQAAERLNDEWDAVCVQHDFASFGGPEGSYLLTLLRALKVPAVTVLHSVLQYPSASQRRVLAQVCELSASVVVMSDRCASLLASHYGVLEEKIEVMPHGVPECEGVTGADVLARFGDDPKLVTSGFLRPCEGFEVAIDAVAQIRDMVPNVRYFILGRSEPSLSPTHAKAYRVSLEDRVRALDLEENVVFIDECTSREELCTYLAGADLYLAPFRSRERSASGTLSYAAAFGVPILATPFPYAEDLADQGAALLFPFEDSTRLAELVGRVIEDSSLRSQLRTSAQMLARTMRWPLVAQRLDAVVQEALEEKAVDGLLRSRLELL
jgi:glycosyltransferase involved in cell wall biosynthesis